MTTALRPATVRTGLIDAALVIADGAVQQIHHSTPTEERERWHS